MYPRSKVKSWDSDSCNPKKLFIMGNWYTKAFPKTFHLKILFSFSITVCLYSSKWNFLFQPCWIYDSCHSYILLCISHFTVHCMSLQNKWISTKFGYIVVLSMFPHFITTTCNVHFNHVMIIYLCIYLHLLSTL